MTVETGFEERWNEVYGVNKDPVREHLISPLLVRESGDLGGLRIADFGTGNGNLFHYLRDLHFLEGVGVDRSAHFLEFARANINDPRVSFTQADLLRSCPVPDRSFDVAYSIFVLNELPEIDFYLQQIEQKLVDNGRLLVVMTHPALALYYQLYEEFKGEKNDKLIGVQNYFDRSPLQYKFTIAQTSVTYFQHTFADLQNALRCANLQLENLLELTTDDTKLATVPGYWDMRNVPKYLYFSARKNRANERIGNSR